MWFKHAVFSSSYFVYFFYFIFIFFIFFIFFFFFSSRRRHTRFDCDWSSDVCSSDLKTYGDLSDPAKLAAFEKNFNDNEDHFRTLLGASSPIFSLARLPGDGRFVDRKSTRLNSSHSQISYAVFCLKKKKRTRTTHASA